MATITVNTEAETFNDLNLSNEIRVLGALQVISGLTGHPVERIELWQLLQHLAAYAVYADGYPIRIIEPLDSGAFIQTRDEVTSLVLVEGF